MHNAITDIPGIRVGHYTDIKSATGCTVVLCEGGKGFDSTVELMKQGYTYLAGPGQNTVVGVVATNALLTRAQATKAAGMAHDGLARAINPSHSMHDGATIFALSLDDYKSDVTTVGSMAAEVTRQAMVSAVRHAVNLDGVPCLNDIVHQ